MSILNVEEDSVGSKQPEEFTEEETRELWGILQRVGENG
jgi:hypothetical protein